MDASPSDFLAAERLLTRPAAEPFELYQSIVEAARRLAPLDACYLCRIDRATETLRFVYVGEDEFYGPGNDVPFGSGPTSRVAKTGRPVFLDDPSEQPAYPTLPFGNETTGSGSAVHWPLWIDAPVGGLPDAVLSVQSRERGSYDIESRAAVEWLALRATFALRDYERRERIQ